MTVSKQSQDGIELVIKKKFVTMHGIVNVKVTMFIFLMHAILVNKAVATVSVGTVCPFLGEEHDACILISFCIGFLNFISPVFLKTFNILRGLLPRVADLRRSAP